MAFLSKEDSFKIYNKYVLDRRNIYIVVSLKCNLSCKHCSMESNSDLTIMPDNYIEKIINQINNKWSVCPFGGEPFLFPEKMEKIANLCYEKNIFFHLNTNAFWAFNNDILNLISKLKQVCIGLSIDEFHEIPIENYIQILDYFKNNKNITFWLETVKNHENEERLDVLKEKGIEYVYLVENINPVGYAKKNFKFENKIRNIKTCNNRGFEIRPDGQIYILCNYHKNCKVGHIDNDIFENLRNKYFRRMPKFLTSKQIELCCLPDEIHNKKWDDRFYIEVLSDSVT